jgi:ABC-type histidine transport system ATPase subunit
VVRPAQEVQELMARQSCQEKLKVADKKKLPLTHHSFPLPLVFQHSNLQPHQRIAYSYI